MSNKSRLLLELILMLEPVRIDAIDGNARPLDQYQPVRKRHEIILQSVYAFSLGNPLSLVEPDPRITARYLGRFRFCENNLKIFVRFALKV